MPIYEYQCPTCGHTFDKLVKMGAEAPPCPECGAAEVTKKVSAAGFILKGGGWYKDHYGLKSGGGEKSGGSEGAKADAPKSDGGSKSEGGAKADSGGGESKKATPAQTTAAKSTVTPS